MTKSKKIIRLSVSLLLLVTMLITPFSPIFAVVIDGSGDTELTAADIVSEDASKREQFSRHYLTGDGTYFAVSYAEQVNYQDEDGNWIPVDNSLSTNILTGEKTTRNVKFKVKFANKANKDDLVSIQTEDYKVSFGITVSEDGENYLSLSKVKGTESESNTSAEPKTTQEATSLGKAVSGITYKNAFSDYLDVRYTVAHEKVKEDIILQKKSDFNSYKATYNIKEKDALATLNENGSVTFTSPEGEILFTVGVPVMYDSDGKSSTDIAVSMVQTAKTVEVTYTPNAEWLSAEDRVYPVTIDPTTSTTDYDSNIIDLCFYATDAYYPNSYQFLTVGMDFYDYIQFDYIPTIPNNATLSGASLVLQGNSVNNWGDAEYCYATLAAPSVAWDEDSFGDGEGQYNYYDGMIPLDSFYTLNDISFNYNYDEDAPHYILELSLEGFFTTAVEYQDFFDTTYGFELVMCHEYEFRAYASEYTVSAYHPAVVVRYGNNGPDIISGKLYHIKNNSSNTYITIDSIDDLFPSNTSLLLSEKNPNNPQQVFKITYNTVQGVYKIRAYVNLDMHLNYNSNNEVLVNSTEHTWMIIPRADGCSVYDDSNTNALTINNDSIQMAAFSSTDPKQSWDFELVENQYDATVSQTFYLNTMDRLYCSNAYAESQEWDSRNRDIALVSQMGAILAYKPGTTAIDTPYDTAITICVLFPEGIYFFENKEYSKTMQIDDDSAPTAFNAKYELHDFDGETYQKWRITYLDEGYYKITSIASTWAMTAPDSVNGAVTQTSFNWAQTQQWTIDYTHSGAYKLSPRSNPNYYLAAGSGIDIDIGNVDTTNDRNVEMRAEQDDGKDDWKIRKVVSAYSIGGEFAGGRDVIAASESWRACGYTSNYLLNPTVDQLTEDKLNSEIVYFSVHGLQHNIEFLNKIFISDGLSDTDNPQQTLNINDLSIAKSKLYIYDACLTATTTDSDSQNLCTQTVAAGVDCVIGWTIEIYPSGSQKWQSHFQSRLIAGDSVIEAANYANTFSYGDENYRIKSWRIYGDEDLVINELEENVNPINDNKLISTFIYYPQHNVDTVKSILSSRFDDFSNEEAEIVITYTNAEQTSYVIDYMYYEDGEMTYLGYTLIVQDGIIIYIRDNTEV